MARKKKCVTLYGEVTYIYRTISTHHNEQGITIMCTCLVEDTYNMNVVVNDDEESNYHVQDTKTLDETKGNGNVFLTLHICPVALG
jgi:hypothetical protein